MVVAAGLLPGCGGCVDDGDLPKYQGPNIPHVSATSGVHQRFDFKGPTVGSLMEAGGHDEAEAAPGLAEAPTEASE
jgi:hypothetical protein